VELMVKFSELFSQADKNEDDDFESAQEDSSDDEETIQEQETAESNTDYQKEIKELEVKVIHHRPRNFITNVLILFHRMITT
jgi:hypothetical protein